jgi:hypothetical protein
MKGCNGSSITFTSHEIIQSRFWNASSHSICPTICNKFGTNCSQLVRSLMALSDLLQSCSNKSDTVIIQQECYKVEGTKLQQYCYIMTVLDLLEQPCNRLVNSLFQTCWQLGISSVNTTCWRLVGSKMWDFCVCTVRASVDKLISGTLFWHIQ